MNGSEAPLEVAVVGAGIIGIILSHALLERKVPVKLYEQAKGLTLTGGGLNAHEAGVRALKHCGPKVLAAFEEVRQPHHAEDPDHFFWLMNSIDGEAVDLRSENDFASLQRSKFVEALAGSLPEGFVQFQKRVVSLGNRPDGRVQLDFEDGSRSVADVVLGCDGLKSMIRSYVVGSMDSPDTSGAVRPSFSYNVIHRGLVTKEEFGATVGESLAKGAHVSFGRDDGYVFYPVSPTHANMGYFRRYTTDWPHWPNLTAPILREELLALMEKSEVPQRHLDLVRLFPDEVIQWAIYDLCDTPLKSYCNECVAVLGDAAHASSPFLNAGAGQGYEDAAVVGDLIQHVMQTFDKGDGYEWKRPSLVDALEAYSQTRIGRTQALVSNSRRAGEIIKGAVPFSEAAEKYKQMNFAIWAPSIVDMSKEAVDRYEKLRRRRLNLCPEARVTPCHTNQAPAPSATTQGSPL